MSRVQIGSRYTGPCYDKPCLRQLPRHWVLEEVRTNYRPAWYRRVEVWAIAVVILWLLAGAAQLGAISQQQPSAGTYHKGTT